jgi:hypothetical protein
VLVTSTSGGQAPYEHSMLHLAFLSCFLYILQRSIHCQLVDKLNSVNDMSVQHMTSDSCGSTFADWPLGHAM